MRLHFSRLFSAFAMLLATVCSPSPAAAQIEPNADTALSCALIYAWMGDTGPGYDGLVTKAATLGGRSESAVRADLAERLPRIHDGIADGRLDAADLQRVAGGACPTAFAVAPAVRRAVVAPPSPPRPDPAECAGLFRWFDAQFPPNAWGTTWAGDEMVRRAAAATGTDYAAMDRRAGTYAPATSATAPLLDRAVACQNAYDTPVPPGAVLAAAQSGDRPGIDRGRSQYCRALGNDFDSRFPDVGSIEDAIARNPQSAGDKTYEMMKSLQWYLDALGKADCPGDAIEPRFNAFQDFTGRATRALTQAKDRLRREGKWW